MDLSARGDAIMEPSQLDFKAAVLRNGPRVSPIQTLAPPPGFTPEDDARAVLAVLEQRIKAAAPSDVDVVEAPLPEGGASDAAYVRRCLSDVLDGMVALAGVLLRMERRLDQEVVMPESTHDETR